jgi:hypothetical protein
MAILSNGIQFTGSIGGMSAYKMKGSDKIIFRLKGGGSKTRIKRSASCLLTRQNGTEFGGCAKAAAGIRNAIFPVVHLKDHNFISSLTALSKSIQLFDEDSKRGQRSICFSQHKYLLEGFHLNKGHHFDSIVRHPLHANLNRATGTAMVQLPDLLPRLNLFIPWQYPLFRFVVSIGVIKDTVYHRAGYPKDDTARIHHTTPAFTPWSSTLAPFGGQSLSLQLSHVDALNDSKSILLAVGMELGTPIGHNNVKQATDAGCARILMVR